MQRIKFMVPCVHLHACRSSCPSLSVVLSLPMGSSAVCPVLENIVGIDLLLFAQVYMLRVLHAIHEG